MLRRVLIGILGLAGALALGGCVTSETKPIQKINAIQAHSQIPADELLDVGVRVLDPGIPQDLADDEEALAKKRIYPEIREAESRYMATALRSTLETSGQWGAVRVVPTNVEFVDVTVNGRIVESTGAKLALDVSVTDSTGRVWIANKHYEELADLGSYKTDASLKARDPFQNIYARIANDMVAARDALLADQRRDIRRITELKFANDLAPAAMHDYLATDEKGYATVVRLPAANDPISERIERIRERDEAVVDTVNGYYASFSEQMQASYGSWRRTSFDEIEKEQRTRSQARTRTILGAAAILASVFVPGQCSQYDYNCRRIESAARTAGAIGGTAAILSGLKRYSDAKVHAQALQELSESFKSEVAPQVVDVEGRTLRLTGTAEEQYREWRKLLHELYLEEAVPGPKAGPASDDGGSAEPAAAPVPTSAPAIEDAAAPPAPATASEPLA